jgi:hypothetical protein
VSAHRVLDLQPNNILMGIHDRAAFERLEKNGQHKPCTDERTARSYHLRLSAHASNKRTSVLD